MLTKTKADRDWKVIEAVANGERILDVAKAHGISRARADQIIESAFNRLVLLDPRGRAKVCVAVREELVARLKRYAPDDRLTIGDAIQYLVTTHGLGVSYHTFVYGDRDGDLGIPYTEHRKQANSHAARFYLRRDLDTWARGKRAKHYALTQENTP